MYIYYIYIHICIDMEVSQIEMMFLRYAGVASRI